MARAGYAMTTTTTTTINIIDVLTHYLTR